MTAAALTSHPTRLTIELDPGAEPIRGWLQQGIDPWQAFHGMTELLALLDSARERAARRPRQPRTGEDPAPGAGERERCP